MSEELKVEKGEGESAGISFEQAKGEIKPPLEGYEGEGGIEGDQRAAEEVVGKRITGKVPISPAMVKPPLRFEGLILSEATGYPGWIYTEEDLDDIATLIQECGWELNPAIQVFVALLTLHGAKFVGFQNWKRSGRIGDLKQKSGTGEHRREDRPGEEVQQ